MIKEYLWEFLYTAEMASLNLSISLNDNNIQFMFEGYSSSLSSFINETITWIKQFDPSPLQKDFESIKSKWLKDKHNAYF